MLKNRAIFSLIGVSGFLLIILFLLFDTSESKVLLNSHNIYLPVLPNYYVNEIEKLNITDSSFVSFVAEESVRREIVIVREKNFNRHERKTNFSEEKTNFNIQLYPLNTTIDSLSYPIIEEPIIYVYNKKEYEVYRHTLPLIGLKKIIIKQQLKNKEYEPWEDMIKPKFSSIKIHQLSPQKDFNGQKRIPNIYNPLASDIFSSKGITTLPFTYLKTDSLLEEIWAMDKPFLSEKKLTAMVIDKPRAFWNSLMKKDIKGLDAVSFEGPHSIEIKKSLNSYIKGEIRFEEVFNIQKFADYYAINNLFYNSSCGNVLKMAYNKKEELLEPFFDGLKCSVTRNRFLKKSLITNQEFVSKYAKSLHDMANTDIYDEFVRASKELPQKLALINESFPEKLFDYDLLNINKRIIQKSLNPSTSLIAEVISMDRESMVISIHNVTNYTLELIGLNYKNKKNVVLINQRESIDGGKKDTLSIELPRSFENLFVTKKKKQIGFQFHKHIFDISLSFRVAGLYNVQSVNIIPYQPKEKTDEDLFRQKIELSKYQYLKLDNSTLTINNPIDSITISAPLIIPKGYIFSLKAGTVMNIKDGGKIISYSPLRFIGKKNSPITISSSDKRGQGILILADGELSELEHVSFKDLSNPKHGNWNVTGAITFYESPVNMSNVSITNNTCEDALNIVRSNFSLTNSSISNTQSDAFDGDFVEGIISSCSFDNLGNDAIDVSGSNITVRDVQISLAGDKGLSAGENSKMTIENVNISNSEIAIAGKDLSVVKAKNLTFNTTKLGFTAFQKKPEYGPSYISVKGLKIIDVETNYLIENSSTLIVDGNKIETSQYVKSRMYGVEFGRSSAETRNNQ